MAEPTDSYVYVIGSPSPATGPVKIGWTRQHPMVRLFNLRLPSRAEYVPTGVDRSTLAVLFEYKGDHATEQLLHARFADRWVAGEWFAIDPLHVQRELEGALARMDRCYADGCDRSRWDESIYYCRAHDLELWMRPARNLAIIQL